MGTGGGALVGGLIGGKKGRWHRRARRLRWLGLVHLQATQPKPSVVIPQSSESVSCGAPPKALRRNGKVRINMKSVKLTLVPLLFITLVQAVWAAPSLGAAHRHYRELTSRQATQRRQESGQELLVQQASDRLPAPVSFRVVRDRGLLVDAWINGSGPYTLAIDTGAGSTIISARLAEALDISTNSGRRISLSGLSGREQHRGTPA